MISYTKQDIIDELLIIKNKTKTRKPHIIDMRNYLISILYYKFGLSEEIIFSLTNLNNRCSINHAKRKACDLYIVGDKIFLKNVDELIKKYPCNFNEFNTVKTSYNKSKTNTSNVKISFELSKRRFEKFSNYMIAKKISKPDEAAKKLILSVLKLWEE